MKMPRHAAGRWAVLEHPASSSSGDERAEAFARQLLLRWGVVFRDLIARETLAPPWRDLLVALRRMEARGEIRGGRFVSGFLGEQYGRAEAVDLLRSIRRNPSDAPLKIPAADPLNLVGLLTPGARLPALTGNRVLYRDGLPLAVLSGGETQFLQPLAGKERWDAQNALIRRASAPLTEAADAKA